uniref:(northern house mosquito) hypothetical protein n=1 Tax=Culex pipiens TaxID=7175 RepID=A0A8D8BA29_CULPI
MRSPKHLRRSLFRWSVCLNATGATCAWRFDDLGDARSEVSESGSGPSCQRSSALYCNILELSEPLRNLLECRNWKISLRNRTSKVSSCSQLCTVLRHTKLPKNYDCVLIFRTS